MTGNSEPGTRNYALAGLKVVDVAINYAGPTSSMYLADQGADVIKI